MLFQPSNLLLGNRCQWKIVRISQFTASYLKTCLFCVCKNAKTKKKIIVLLLLLNCPWSVVWMTRSAFYSRCQSKFNVSVRRCKLIAKFPGSGSDYCFKTMLSDSQYNINLFKMGTNLLYFHWLSLIWLQCTRLSGNQKTECMDSSFQKMKSSTSTLLFNQAHVHLFENTES